MKVLKKKIDDKRVELSVTVPASEVARAFDSAHVEFATQLGIRPTKEGDVEQALKEKLGISDLDSVTITQAVGFLSPLAIDKSGLTPAYPPEPVYTRPPIRGKDFKFTVEIMPKPDYELTSYEPVHVSIPEFEVFPEDVEARIQTFVEKYVKYEKAAPHALGPHDNCMISMECSAKDEDVSGLNTEGRTYTTGDHLMPDGFDEQIIGMNVGETRSFTFNGVGLDKDFNETSFKADATVVLLEIQDAVYPEVTDEFITEAGLPYKNAQDFRDQMWAEEEKESLELYHSYKLQAVIEELSKRFEGKILDGAYKAMSKEIMDVLQKQLQAQRIDPKQYIEQYGGQEQFNMVIMIQTRKQLVQGYALAAIYRHEKLKYSQEDLDKACQAMLPGAKLKPSEIRKQLERSGRGFAMREAAELTCAGRYLVEHAIVTPPAQTPKNAGQASLLESEMN